MFTSKSERLIKKNTESALAKAGQQRLVDMCADKRTKAQRKADYDKFAYAVVVLWKNQ